MRGEALGTAEGADSAEGALFCLDVSAPSSALAASSAVRLFAAQSRRGRAAQCIFWASIFQ